jgi:hypothetical protein
MTNPLSQYFRQPAIYARLPSNGEFYPPGTLDMPPNGELPVYPMTAIDEITYRTPDALFNGSAVITVIQSCIPNIKDAWAIPSTDIDTLLTAIRIASYGHDMEVACFCPKCATQDDLTLDLRTVIDSMVAPDYSKPVMHGDLEIYFKPMNYLTLNRNNQMQFEEQKTIQMLAENKTQNNTSDEENSQRISEIIKKITDMTVVAIGQSIASIKTPTAFVNDSDHITEFLKNCDRTLFNQIRDRVIDLKQKAELKPLHVTCSNCQYAYEQNFTLDLSSFFEPAS